MLAQEWLGEDNTIGVDIWNNKYRSGEESFDEWLDRVSAGDQELRRMIVEKKFLFGGRILANRGTGKNGRKVSYSNCYVVTPPEDNIESIFECSKKLARTYSYGGGCGVDISKLAPRGSKVNNAANSSSGAVSFMDLYSMTTGLIAQQGRRGALMISLACDHPDVEEFINCKNDLSKVNFANISVRVSDDFMRAVVTDQPYELIFRREETGEVIHKSIMAKELFRKLAENNWRTGEPGILFWDAIKNWNMLSGTPEFEYAGTNPCAEEPLPAGGSCLLGSLNLSEYVEDKYTTAAMINWKALGEDIHTAVYALNNVLDEGLPLHPLEEQRESVKNWRQIGLGIMGLADMLIKMNIQYGGDLAIMTVNNLFKFIINTATEASSDFAAENGKVYPKFNYNDVAKTGFYRSNIEVGSDIDKKVMSNGLANSQILTIAPTGSISTMIGCSSGIEPLFALEYNRKTKTLHDSDFTYKVYPLVVKEYMNMNRIESVSDLPDQFVTAQNIHYSNRVDMQGTIQKYIDASISSTVNAPNDFTVDDVEKMYILAWKRGLKGITFFRDGCERAGILTTESNDNNNGCDCENILSQRGTVKKIGDDPIGLERHLTTGCGSLHCSAFFDRNTGELLETYLNKGSKGGCLSSLSGLSRMISLSARAGVSIDDIVDQLSSALECCSYSVRRAVHKDTSKGNCCPTAVGNALKDMYDEMNKIINNTDVSRVERGEQVSLSKNNNECPECGDTLVSEGGCVVCKSCGWSKCG